MFFGHITLRNYSFLDMHYGNSLLFLHLSIWQVCLSKATYIAYTFFFYAFPRSWTHDIGIANYYFSCMNVVCLIFYILYVPW